MSYEKILVGTDGSTSAQRAERVASFLAESFGADLLMAMAGSEPSQSLLQEIQARAQGTEVRFGAGNPAEVLVRTAEQEMVGLLVIGNKGMSGGGLSLLSNVPNKVSHHAPCDVLIVNTSVAGSRLGYQKILVGTDGSPTADIAVRKASRMADRLGCSLSLISVGANAKGVLSRVIEELALSNVTAIEEQGDPASKICEVAEAMAFDLIVIGNKGMTGSRRFLLGSVPNKISHYALRDVLIARTDARSISDLAFGEGAVVLSGGDRVAAFKSEEGTITAVSAKCTHLGCTVGWNPEEKTWDCPCHGSRYDFTGKVIRGPASKDLAPIQINE